MAGNQVGKTTISCVEMTYHLTGIYPEKWEGYRFRNAINGWALGATFDQLCDVLQIRFLGEERNKQFEGNLIPAPLILNKTKIGGQRKGSVRQIKILHKSKQASKLSFFSYQQGQDVLMGNIVDFILVDEEPLDQTIYPQLLSRTPNADHKRGGLILLSFTPEHGTTELVEQFQNDLKPKQSIMKVGWSNAPHMTEENKAQLLSAIPPYLRPAKSEGTPALGSGAIYPFFDDKIKDDIVTIPDHWPRICGIDFGWNFTALVWLAWDRDADIIHLYDCLKIEHETPSEIALKIRARGDWIPVSWPADGHLPERGSGEPQKDLYIKEGVNMLGAHATDENGSNSVEAGIMRNFERFRDRRLLVAPHLEEFFREKRMYRRENGKILKKNDHILDALRYGEMMIRYAIVKFKPPQKEISTGRIWR